MIMHRPTTALRFLVASLALLASLAVHAYSYVMMSDEALFEQAEGVIRARVERVLPANDGDSETRYELHVEEVLAGPALASPQTLVLPGTFNAPNTNFIVPGIPQLKEGGTILVFHSRRADGVLQAPQLTLGVFAEVTTSQGTYYVRSLGDAHEYGKNARNERYHLAREATAFAAWLRGRRNAEWKEADYFEEVTGIEEIVKARFLTDPRRRWFEFDQGEELQWTVSPSTPPEIINGLKWALAAWNDDPKSKILMSYSGTAIDRTICAASGINLMSYSYAHVCWNDPRDYVGEGEPGPGVAYNCGGGTLAWAGTVLHRIFPTGNFAGQAWNRNAQGFLVLQNGIKCYLIQDVNENRNGENAAVLLTHEVGHVLGFGHSCEGEACESVDEVARNATMRTPMHQDGRGGMIFEDDIAIAHVAYPAPSNATTAVLRFNYPNSRHAANNPQGANGPVTKTIVRNSGTPVELAWRTRNLPAGAKCGIYLSDGILVSDATPVSKGTRTYPTMSAWTTGSKVFNLRCIDGSDGSSIINSPNITLNITSPPQVLISTNFSTNPFTQTPAFLLRYGQNVTWQPGQALISQDVTDAGGRIETAQFSPTDQIEIKMRHVMTPGSAGSNYFLPLVGFGLEGDRRFNLMWLRSAFGPDYCNLTGGYDKVMVRWWNGTHENCILGELPAVTASTLYQREIHSTITYDRLQGLVTYVARDQTADGNIIAQQHFLLPSAANGRVTKIHIGGYGWWTGHKHLLREMRISRPEPPSATLRFDTASGPTTKTIVRNSGTPVTLVWRTQDLPAGTTCQIYLSNGQLIYNAIPIAGDSRTHTNMHMWATGPKVFNLRCSNGTNSPNITLNINSPTPPSATLRFDSASGPTTKTIVRNSGTPVTLVWRTQSLPAGTTCQIYLSNGQLIYNAIPISGDSRTHTNMHTWATGPKVFNLRCSNGTNSPNITLNINSPTPPSATLRFDTANGPTAKTIVRNSGTPVTLVWRTQSLPAGTTCQIYLSNGQLIYNAMPISGDSRTHTNMHTWATGPKVFNLRCNNGTNSPNITLNIVPPGNVLTVQISSLEGGTGYVTSSPAGINCGNTCEASFAPGTQVTLTATRTGNSLFAGWTGACDGASPTCTVAMNVASTVGAVFAKSDAVRQISPGHGFTCVVTMTGEAKCWGNNTSGELGDGTYTRRLSPVTVSGLSSGVRAISTGRYHTCALTDAGAVKCWGYYSDGPYTVITYRTVPTDVPGLSSGVQAIGAGSNFNCALTTGGAVRCWGANGDGQIGDGTQTHRSTPVTVTGLSSGIARIAVGGSHACALATSGAVKCWGDNSSGQVGDSQYYYPDIRKTPFDVLGLSSGVRSISAGGSQSCAVTTAGEVRCWGARQYTGSAFGTVYTYTNIGGPSWRTPTPVDGLGGGIKEIALGETHVCALTNAGAVKCWGTNWNGELGNGTTADSFHTPVPVTGLNSGVTAISAGTSASCAILTNGAARCWGHNGYGQIGDGTTVQRTTPVRVSGLDGTAPASNPATARLRFDTADGASSKTVVHNSGTPVTFAWRTQDRPAGTCSPTTSGAARCWSENAYGQLDNGISTRRLAPSVVPDQHWAPARVVGW